MKINTRVKHIIDGEATRFENKINDALAQLEDSRGTGTVISIQYSVSKYYYCALITYTFQTNS